MQSSLSMAAQAEQMRRNIWGDAPRSQPVFHYWASIPQSGAETLREIREKTLRWVESEMGVLSPEVWQKESFDRIIRGSKHVEAALSERGEEKHWGLHFSNPDSRVATRNWDTEIGLHQLSQENMLFSLQQTVYTSEDSLRVDPMPPGVVGEIASSPGLRIDGRPIATAPWVLAGEPQVEELIALLRDPNRRLPAYIISSPRESATLADAYLDVASLARRCVGLAHVAFLPWEEGFALSRAFGKEFSAYYGAARIYQPGFDDATDSPFDHPLLLAMRIRVDRKHYENRLVYKAAQNSLEDRTWALPGFHRIKRESAQQNREYAQKNEKEYEELLVLADLENQALQEENKDLQNEKQLLEETNKDLRTALKEQKNYEYSLSMRIRNLELLVDKGKERLPTQIQPLESWEMLNEWATQYLGGKVYLHNRALRAVKNAQFENIPLVGECLLLLANQYREMRRDGGRECKDAFDEELRKLSVEHSKSIGKTGRGEFENEYYLKYEGRECFLDSHLKRGTSKDEKYSLRIYFFWDEEREIVVVGSLPAHLTTRAT